MTKDAIYPEDMPVPASPLSPAIRAGGFVFVSGQVPIDGKGELLGDDFEGQLDAVLDNVERCLAAAGCALRDTVKTMVYLTDASNFAALNRRYAERFPEPRPARTTIMCGLADGRFLVEIDVVARAPDAP